MTDKNVQIKDVNGNLLFPKTKAAVVYNDNNESLGGVAAGAQVNVIETIKVNGSALTPDANKAVDISVASYTITKATTPDAGYAATYQLFQGQTAVGDKINIPKDMVISSGELKYCETAGVPVSGMAVGDPYIELTIANNDGSKIYIPVKDLVDTYTAGNGLDLNNGQFSVDTTDSTIADSAPTQNSTKFLQSGGAYTALAGKQNTIDSTHKLSADLVQDGSTNGVLTLDQRSAMVLFEELS